MDAKLVVISGRANRKQVTIRLPASVGRGADQWLRIEHKTISRHHCDLFEREGQLIVRDCGSANGTLVDDAPVREAVVEPGHRLTIGPLVFEAHYSVGNGIDYSPTVDAGVAATVGIPRDENDLLDDPITIDVPEREHVAAEGEPDAAVAAGDDLVFDEQPAAEADLVPLEIDPLEIESLESGSFETAEPAAETPSGEVDDLAFLLDDAPAAPVAEANVAASEPPAAAPVGESELGFDEPTPYNPNAEAEARAASQEVRDFTGPVVDEPSQEIFFADEGLVAPVDDLAAGGAELAEINLLEADEPMAEAEAEAVEPLAELVSEEDRLFEPDEVQTFAADATADAPREVLDWDEPSAELLAGETPAAVAPSTASPEDELAALELEPSPNQIAEEDMDLVLDDAESLAEATRPAPSEPVASDDAADDFLTSLALNETVPESSGSAPVVDFHDVEIVDEPVGADAVSEMEFDEVEAIAFDEADTMPSDELMSPVDVGPVDEAADVLPFTHESLEVEEVEILPLGDEVLALDDDAQVISLRSEERAPGDAVLPIEAAADEVVSLDDVQHLIDAGDDEPIGELSGFDEDDVVVGDARTEPWAPLDDGTDKLDQTVPAVADDDDFEYEAAGREEDDLPHTLAVNNDTVNAAQVSDDDALAFLDDSLEGVAPSSRHDAREVAGPDPDFVVPPGDVTPDSATEMWLAPDAATLPSDGLEFSFEEADSAPAAEVEFEDLSFDASGTGSLVELPELPTVDASGIVAPVAKGKGKGKEKKAKPPQAKVDKPKRSWWPFGRKKQAAAEPAAAAPEVALPASADELPAIGEPPAVDFDDSLAEGGDNPFAAGHVLAPSDDSMAASEVEFLAEESLDEPVAPSEVQSIDEALTLDSALDPASAVEPVADPLDFSFEDEPAAPLPTGSADSAAAPEFAPIEDQVPQFDELGAESLDAADDEGDGDLEGLTQMASDESLAGAEDGFDLDESALGEPDGTTEMLAAQLDAGAQPAAEPATSGQIELDFSDDMSMVEPTTAYQTASPPPAAEPPAKAKRSWWPFGRKDKAPKPPKAAKPAKPAKTSKADKHKGAAAVAASADEVAPGGADLPASDFSLDDAALGLPDDTLASDMLPVIPEVSSIDDNDALAALEEEPGDVPDFLQPTEPSDESPSSAEQAAAEDADLDDFLKGLR